MGQNNQFNTLNNDGYINQGSHIGDICYQNHVLTPPPEGHKNAIDCPECDNLTWKHSPHCVNCGYEVKQHYFQLELGLHIDKTRSKVLKQLLVFMVLLAACIGLAIIANYISMAGFLILGLALVMKPDIEKNTKKLERLKAEQQIFWHKKDFFKD